VVALVGDYGAGKSTFVKMLAGVIMPDVSGWSFLERAKLAALRIFYLRECGGHPDLCSG
jgi:ABC-type sugar transport system ATPase subunit